MPVKACFSKWWASKREEFPFRCETRIRVHPSKVQQAIGDSGQFISASTNTGGTVWGFTTEEALIAFQAVYAGIFVQ